MKKLILTLTMLASLQSAAQGHRGGPPFEEMKAQMKECLSTQLAGDATKIDLALAKLQAAHEARRAAHETRDAQEGEGGSRLPGRPQGPPPELIDASDTSEEANAIRTCHQSLRPPEGQVRGKRFEGGGVR